MGERIEDIDFTKLIENLSDHDIGRLAGMLERAHKRIVFRAHANAALGALTDILDNGNTAHARITAAREILDRGLGKAWTKLESPTDNHKRPYMLAIPLSMVKDMDEVTLCKAIRAFEAVADKANNE